MPLACIERLDVSVVRLEIPLRDFEHLARWLGCSLERKATHLILATEQASCSLRFDIEGDRTLLADVQIRDDVQGRFTQQVLGTLLARYEGDLDAEMTWKPHRRTPRLVVQGGLSSHPFFTPVAIAPQDVVVSDVDQLLLEAKSAWEEYQRHKASHERQQGARPKA